MRNSSDSRRVKRNTTIAPPRGGLACWSGLFFLFLFGAAGLFQSYTQAEDVKTSGEIVVGNDFTCSPRFEAYRVQRALFSRNAIERGYVDYAEAVKLLYPKEAITETLLKQKLQWREEHLGTFVFATEYQRLNSPVTVRPLLARREPRLGSTLVACYEANYHVVRISEQAGESAVLHEAGHAMQRAALMKRTYAQESFVSASYQSRGFGYLESEDLASYKQRAVQRLDYLSSQDEFEVRLQDLNRFYAVWGNGSPIQNPIEAARALLALGMPLSYENLTIALQGTKYELKRNEFEDLLRGTAKVATPGEREVFEDAAELLTLRDLVFELDSTLWPLCLRKILFESPGHL